MGESSKNISNCSKSALNLWKKSDLVQKTLDLRVEIVVDGDLCKLCEKIETFTKSMN